MEAKGKVVVKLYYFIGVMRKPEWGRFYKYAVYFPLYVIYKMITDLILKCEIPPSCEIRKDLKVYHATWVVINSNAQIGNNVVLRQNTTIGKKMLQNVDVGSPKIGHNVNIGANCVVLGPVTIGEGAIIGAGPVVVKDIESGSSYAGNPAKLIRKL